MNYDSSYIEMRASEILDKFSMRRYPVDVELLAKRLGIKVVAGDMDGAVSGFLKKDGDITVIGVNSGHSIKRQRFTIGHEIGHCILHLDEASPMFVDKSSTSAFFARDRESAWGVHSKEIEANSFAASLLMPEDLIRDCLIKYSIRFSSIEDIAWRMAKDFNVSEQAMTLRLIKLGIFEH
jgi:Zn-dependent peptidase ImmA (M78 family)